VSHTQGIACETSGKEVDGKGLDCEYPCFMKMFADLAARSGKVDLEEAKREEILVPIHLEFDVEHHQMREAFVWNLNGRIVLLVWTGHH
jgi:hypothetical protein